MDDRDIAMRYKVLNLPSSLSSTLPKNGPFLSDATFAAKELPQTDFVEILRG